MIDYRKLSPCKLFYSKKIKTFKYYINFVKDVACGERR